MRGDVVMFEGLGRTPLWSCAAVDAVDCAQLLLGAGADVWHRDGKGQTVVVAAKQRANKLAGDAPTDVFQLLGHHARLLRVGLMVDRLADLDPRLRTCNMSRAKLSSNGLIEKLAKAVAVNTIVEELVMDDAELGAGGVALLAAGLKTNSSVKILHLRGAGVGPADIAPLKACLTVNTAILTMDLDDRTVAAAVQPLLQINRELSAMPTLLTATSDEGTAAAATAAPTETLDSSDAATAAIAEVVDVDVAANVLQLCARHGKTAPIAALLAMAGRAPAARICPTTQALPHSMLLHRRNPDRTALAAVYKAHCWIEAATGLLISRDDEKFRLICDTLVQLAVNGWRGKEQLYSDKESQQLLQQNQEEEQVNPEAAAAAASTTEPAPPPIAPEEGDIEEPPPGSIAAFAAAAAAAATDAAEASLPPQAPPPPPEGSIAALAAAAATADTAAAAVEGMPAEPPVAATAASTPQGTLVTLPNEPPQDVVASGSTEPAAAAAAAAAPGKYTQMPVPNSINTFEEVGQSVLHRVLLSHRAGNIADHDALKLCKALVAARPELPAIKAASGKPLETYLGRGAGAKQLRAFLVSTVSASFLQRYVLSKPAVVRVGDRSVTVMGSDTVNNEDVALKFFSDYPRWKRELQTAKARRGGSVSVADTAAADVRVLPAIDCALVDTARSLCFEERDGSGDAGEDGIDDECDGASSTHPFAFALLQQIEGAGTLEELRAVSGAITTAKQNGDLTETALEILRAAYRARGSVIYSSITEEAGDGYSSSSNNNNNSNDSNNAGGGGSASGGGPATGSGASQTSSRRTSAAVAAAAEELLSGPRMTQALSLVSGLFNSPVRSASAALGFDGSGSNQDNADVRAAGAADSNTLAPVLRDDDLLPEDHKYGPAFDRTLANRLWYVGALAEGRCNELVEAGLQGDFLVRKADGAEEGNDPLVVLLGEALQLFNRHKFHMDATLFGGLQNGIDRFLTSARHKNAVYFLARFEGL